MSLAERLEHCYSGAVYDVLRAIWHADCVLPSALRPLDPDRRLVGPVFTVEGQRDASIGEHESLLAWTGLLSKAQPVPLTTAHLASAGLAGSGKNPV